MQFGYTRKDVIVLGVGILGFGYALYYGLQAAGYDALVAGNIVQIFVFLGIGVGYISTYIFRVANKVCFRCITSHYNLHKSLQTANAAEKRACIVQHSEGQMTIHQPSCQVS